MTAANHEDIVFSEPEQEVVVGAQSQDGQTKQIQTWIGEFIRSMIAAGGTDSARVPGNWPNSAVYAVEFQYRDKQFPSVSQSRHVMFFDCEKDYEAWRDDKREFVKGTDHDFEVHVEWYRWDLGPQFLGSYTI